MIYLKYLSFILPPLIAFVIFFYLQYKFSNWTISFLLRAFLVGMLSIVLVLVVQIVASMLDLDRLSNIRRIIFYSLVVSAFFAELGKFIVLKAFVYPKKEFKTPVDGIMLSVMISMGFATMNNILYFINIPHLAVNIPNALTAGPANAIFGVMMGFFIGLGKLRKMRIIDSMTGLAAAVFFHGLYSFCLLTKDYRLMWAFFIGSAIIALSLYIASVRIHQDALAEEKR
ncbi:MAG: PrsW family glutamic-type intramembrane protease [Bacteroidales bacterium]|jgi:RsiW-degrading membrane proteinase PrsW (M82 family)|nr:PrsW family glutamic-type intramembrane protease [Bacteroidales bacterium]